MKKQLLALSALALSLSAPAQLSTNYPASNALVVTSTYTDLGTNGTVITTANNDDALSAAQSIGFNFTYNGVTYTDFILSTNGWIKLGTVNPSAATLFYNAPQTSTPTTSGGIFNSTNVADVNMIAAFCLDLTGAAGVEYRSYTTGAVGSRVCTIQWKNVTEKTSSVATQYTAMQFQIKLYETSNIIDIVMGQATPSTNASAFKSAIVGLRGSSNASNQLIAVTKGSTQNWDLATFLSGNYTGNSFNYGNNVGNVRPLPIPGITYRFIPTYPNDVAVLAIYTLGKLPKQYVSPHYIQARIKNSGTATQSNFKVYLHIGGTNTYDDSVTVATLAPAGETTVSFAGYTPFLNGLDTITVYVVPDDNNFNNQKSNTQLVNDDVYAYADPSIPAAGGIGFTGGTGNFVAKFPYSGISNAINQIGVLFAAGGIPLQIGIWGKNASTGAPGTLLWSSSQFTSVTGLNTLPVNPPVTISDTFFVGVIQNTTNNANFGYQAEVPVRSQTFYYSSPVSSTTWLDFSSSSSNFRFMIEPRFQSPNDVGVTSIDYPCQIVPLGQGSLYPFSTVYNYGLLPQINVPVQCAIYLNGTAVYSSTTTATSLTSGGSQQVNFPTLFTPATAGTYTIKSWTTLSGDASNINDTATSTLQVIDYTGISDAGIRVQLDGVDDYISVPNSPVLSPGSTLTLEGWFNVSSTGVVRTLISKDSSATNQSYNLSLNATGNPTFTVKTGNGVVTATSVTALTAGTWYHVAGTYDGAAINIYINGELTGSAVQTGLVTPANTPLFLGKTGGTTPLYFSGGMEEVRIWASARTANEIRTYMHTSIAPFSDPNILCYLRFDEGAGTFYTADASGNCNHGTLVNMDVANTTASPVWYFSTIPIGTPVVVTQPVTGSGPITFTNANLSINFANYTGSEDYYVHMFNSAPTGTQPSTTPGGITAVHPRTWLIYHYGSASFTSADANFDLINNTLLPTAVNSDVKLFNRSNGSGAGWALTYNSATALNITPPSALYTFTSPSQFNQQFVIGGNNNPLPIRLISFSAAAEQQDALLSWQTSSAEHTNSFVIERSFDGSLFEQAGIVMAKGSHNGFNDYSFTDKNIALGHSVVFYRLRMLDYDGRTSFSDVRMVSFRNANGSFSVQPNPFSKTLSVQFHAAGAEEVQLIISDLLGHVVLREMHSLHKGFNVLQLDVASLPAGMYLIQCSTGAEVYTQKILKQ